ncbi:hypothetical protein AN477_22955 [Alicyclobacillus ferrooxydans]|uniref:Uncharacterized protein n=1 Tax=Alicyclobacillus ferrooxydans TaxID=471514 RepID=A0A0P9EL99_9BACL|nr:hypothetical protein AN477_22955 [Alicyclobacillus ferrooxydans]
MICDEDIVQCVYCHEFQLRSDVHSVFKTGFGRRNGVDVPLGVCVRCETENGQKTKETGDVPKDQGDR